MGPKQAMNRRPAYRRCEVLFIAIAALVGGLLCALAMTWYLNRDNRWLRVVSPRDEKPVEVLALDRELKAYVRTAEGNLYLCGGNTWRDACRQVSPQELPVAELHAQWRPCGSAVPRVPPEPGTVVDAIEASRCNEATTYARIVLLADGTLWQWRRTYSWVNAFALATGIVLGLGAGAGIAALVIRVRRYLRDV